MLFCNKHNNNTPNKNPSKWVSIYASCTRNKWKWRKSSPRLYFRYINRSPKWHNNMKVLHKLACEPCTMMLIIHNHAAGECSRLSSRVAEVYKRSAPNRAAKGLEKLKNLLKCQLWMKVRKIPGMSLDCLLNSQRLRKW